MGVVFPAVIFHVFSTLQKTYGGMKKISSTYFPLCIFWGESMGHKNKVPKRVPYILLGISFRVAFPSYLPVCV